MSKPIFFFNLQEGLKACASLGIDASKMSMAQMSFAYNKAVAAGKKPAAKPALAKPAIKALEVVSEIATLKAAAKEARSPFDKVGAYAKLSVKLAANLKAEKDPTKLTEIQRELMAAQKSEAYARLAARALDPQADTIQRYLDAADRD
jgi:hypothetical protein